MVGAGTKVAGVKITTDTGTAADSLPNSLPNANYDPGIVADSLSLNPLLSPFFSGRNDVKVSVESLKLDGMADHLTLPVTHTVMMNNPLVVAQGVTIIRSGASTRA
jgi:hypothetical protein